MKRKNKGPRCRDCGRRCAWRETKDGRWALWELARNDWHWWGCPKQEKLRASYKAQCRRARDFAAAMERDA